MHFLKFLLLAPSLLLATQSLNSVQSPRAAPLYQDTPVLRDFRINQPLVQGIRWGLTATAVGAAIGSVVAEPGSRGLMASVGGLYGLLGGTSVGLVVGLVQGWDMEAKRKRGEDSHARFNRFGFEYGFGYSPVFTDNSLPSPVRMSIGPAHLNYRQPGLEGFIDEVRMGYRHSITSYHKEIWGEGEMLLFSRSRRADEHRIGLQLLQVGRRGLWIPYWGTGLGYGWGEEMDKGSYGWFGNVGDKNPIRSPFAELLVGMRLNAFDFAHVQLEASYELYGSWWQIREFAPYPHMGNLQVNLSLGAFVF